MLIKVVTLTGEEKQIDVEPTDKIITIKEKLEEREGIPPEQQRLIHQGKQLKDDRTIESYKFRGEVYRIWLQLRYDNLALSSDVQNLLIKLRQHYFVGLITNGTSRAQWEKIQLLHLESFFDVVLVSGDLLWEKPHRQIFNLACEYLGVQPQQCIMVGDKLETDILGGLKANLGGTVWVPLNSIDIGDDDPRPDYVIKNVTELPTLLPKNPKVPRFRGREEIRNVHRISAPDFEDSNSNSSDGS